MNIFIKWKRQTIMLIFDFDGVLMDSLDEIVLSAYNAVNGCLLDSLQNIPENIITRFKQNRHLFQPIGDALPLMAWCIEQSNDPTADILTRREFARRVKNTPEPLLQRSTYFFTTRNRLIKEHYQRWLALNRPYYPLWDASINYGADKIITGCLLKKQIFMPVITE